MEYLKKLFHEFLNDEGKVEVAGYEFYRDVILRELEEEGYNEAFDDWLAKRRNDNLARADEILNLFDNRPRFKKLQEIYLRGAIIPFVGAGMSMPSGYPGWTTFLYQVLEDTRLSKMEFDALLKAGKYEEAAQSLFEDLPNGCFLERVENAFSLDHSLAGPVQMLPRLFTNAVITTNFDKVLSRCYAEAGLTFDEELLGLDAEELPRSLGENKRTLVKLHGKADSSRKRILTKTEYDQSYKDNSELEKIIEAISTRTLLFIGCSLTVDRTIKCLTDIMLRKGIEKVPRHYAFIQLKESEDRLARRDALASANIYPIWYTDDHDECIEALLEMLMEGKK